MRGARVYWKRKRERKREFSRRISGERLAKKIDGAARARVQSIDALRAIALRGVGRAGLRSLLRHGGGAAQPDIGVARAQHDGVAASAERGRELARAHLGRAEPGHV